MSARMVNLANVPLRDFGNGRAFAASLGRIGPLIGAKELGCQLPIVPAGKKAFPRHAHHANEEMFFILSGAGTYRLGGESFPIRANDIIAAPSGDGETAHQIVNTGGDELRYLAFSDAPEQEPSSKTLPVCAGEHGTLARVPLAARAGEAGTS